jgi:hypothetical protein
LIRYYILTFNLENPFVVAVGDDITLAEAE